MPDETEISRRAKALDKREEKGLLTEGFLQRDDTVRSIAREIAMDISDLETILATHKVTMDQFEVMKRTPRFIGYLEEAITTWQGAANVKERIKHKALSMIEEALPEMFAALISPFQPLNHRVGLLQQITRLAGVGGAPADGEADTAGKVSITINMGDGKAVSVVQETPKVIEGSFNE